MPWAWGTKWTLEANSESICWHQFCDPVARPNLELTSKARFCKHGKLANHSEHAEKYEGTCNPTSCWICHSTQRWIPKLVPRWIPKSHPALILKSYPAKHASEFPARFCVGFCFVRCGPHLEPCALLFRYTKQRGGSKHA